MSVDGKSRVSILDCTLRDGSYLIDYQFTVEDTYLIASALANAGIGRIEIGHGLGLDAQTKQKGKAAESDIKYIESAKAAVGDKAKVGVFFISGIGDIESIAKACDAGLDFIRIGANIDESEKAYTAVQEAKMQGLEVWVNLMKSYIFSPERFASTCLRVSREGVDVVTLVDSAGGMTPKDVGEYVSCARTQVDIGLGFHGHNNLQLGIANCLAGITMGLDYVDASLRGMGRSAGNVPLEILCPLLCRERVDIGKIDSIKLIEYAQDLIAPLMPRDTGLLPDEIASGISYFHSSFQNLVERESKIGKVRVFKTILKLEDSKTASTLIEADIKEAVRAAIATESGKPIYLIQTDLRWLRPSLCQTLEDLRTALGVASAKTAGEIVLTIARSRRDEPPPFRIAPIRIGNGFCIGHIESRSVVEDRMIVAVLGSIARLWLVDTSIEIAYSPANDTRIFRYDDDVVAALAAFDFLRIAEVIKSVYIPEAPDRCANLLIAIVGKSFEMRYTAADAGIALSTKSRFTSNDVEHVKDGGMLIVGQVNAIERQAITIARAKRLAIIRVDMESVLMTEVARLFQYYRRWKKHAGKIDANGVSIVAGGIMGEPGDIIVDSVSAPRLIIGKADGIGGVVSLETSDNNKRFQVANWILSSRL